MMLLDIQTWWAGKELFEQVFWVFAIPFSAVLLVLLITTFTGMDGGLDADIDAEVDADSGAGFQFFTVKNLIGFFTIFGWVGIGCHQMGMGHGSTIGIAIVSGLLMMVTMASLFYFMSKLVEDGTFQVKEAIGKVGEIYLTVPGAARGFGKVQFTVKGGVREMQAMTNDTESLPTGTLVTITGIVDGSILLVTKR